MSGLRWRRRVDGMVARRVALTVLGLMPASLVHAGPVWVEGNLEGVAATGDGRFGGCMAELDIALGDTGLDCAGGWVTFDCAGAGAAPADAERAFDALRAAAVAGKSVGMRVSDEGKLDGYCRASRVKIQDTPHVDDDSDADGVPDLDDDVPLDASETVDTDDDGIGDNADPDDDNDGVADEDDPFPLDPDRSGVPVTIPDAGLRAVIARALDKEPGARLFAHELAVLYRLIANAADIRDLEGLQAATNLRKLWLRGNRIVDLTPLSGLTALEDLDLSFNEISELTPLAGLTALRTLRLQQNNVSDLDPLAGLILLEHLNLSWNKNVSDVTPLAGLTEMTVLDLYQIPLPDLEVLAGMTRLRSLHLTDLDAVSDLTPLSAMTRMEELSIQGSNVSDLTPLAGMTRLRRLWFRFARVADLTPLAGMTSLADLDLDGNVISDVTPLTHLTALERLGLTWNDVSDVTPLSGLAALTRLELGGNRVSDLGALRGLNALTDLELGGNPVSDLGPLAALAGLRDLDLSGTGTSDLAVLTHLTGLTSLDLGYNGIVDLGALAGLAGLTSLDLRSNDISDLEPLAGLVALTRLDLRYNEISDLGALAGLAGLTALVLYGNSVSDLAPLAGLTALTELGLADNNVSDLSPLVANVGLGVGDLVDVEENPLSRASITTHGPALRNRGVTVYFGTVATVEDAPLIYNDNLFVLPVAQNLAVDSLPFREYAKEFYRYFDDDFDFLLFVSNLSGGDQHGYLGLYLSVKNDTQGIGREAFANNADWGSAGRLQGALHFPRQDLIRRGPALHEMMHRWANWVVPPIPHWQFSSASGQLGGFHAANLVDLGNGRYSAGRFGPIANGGNSVLYSPIEMYLAGFGPPEDVPDLIVAEDGAWLRDDNGDLVLADSGDLVFTASGLSVYTVDDLIAEHGPRDPAYPHAQRAFRAAAILLIDADNPAVGRSLDGVSAHVAWFSQPESNGFVANNLYEATRGRATVTMAGLSERNRGRRLAVTKGASLSDDAVREQLHGAAAHRREHRAEAVASPGHRGASDSRLLPDAWRRYQMPVHDPNR